MEYSYECHWQGWEANAYPNIRYKESAYEVKPLSRIIQHRPPQYNHPPTGGDLLKPSEQTAATDPQ